MPASPQMSQCRQLALALATGLWVGKPAGLAGEGVEQTARARQALAVGLGADADDLGRLRVRTEVGERLLGAGEVVRVSR